MYLIVAGVAGLIASAAFYPINFWPALILGIALLYILNKKQNLKKRLVINLAFGFFYQVLTLFWVGTYVGSFAWIALVAMQAVFFLVLSFSSGAFGFAATWVLLEFILRSFPFGGFGWNRLGFALTSSPLNPYFPRVSIVGIAFLFVLIIALVIDHKIKGMVIAITMLIGLTLIPVNVKDYGKINVALVQGGQSQILENTFKNSEITLNKHIKAMSTIKPNTADLVVWPENAIQYDPETKITTRQIFTTEIKRLDAPILINANLSDGTNGTLLLGSESKQSYSKRYLTPFGEFIPFQSFVEKLTDKAKNFVPYKVGLKPYLFITDNGNFRTLICYELLSDSQARTEMNDVDFIIVQTNNSTYFKTWQLEQELAIAQARSAETSRESAYVSTTGKTAIINENGEVTNSYPKYSTGALIDSVKKRSGITPATTYGSWIEYSILALYFIWLVLQVIRRKSLY